MISARKMQANRANARLSTGPKTVHGKTRVAGNARVHGLSISLLADPTYVKDIEALAGTIAGEGASRELQDLARAIAEAQFDLVRISHAKQMMLVCPENAHDAPGRRAVARRRDKHHFQRTPNIQIDRRTATPPDEPGENVASFLTGSFRALERYHRRALARRKFAIRAFDAQRRNEWGK